MAHPSSVLTSLHCFWHKPLTNPCNDGMKSRKHSDRWEVSLTLLLFYFFLMALGHWKVWKKLHNIFSSFGSYLFYLTPCGIMICLKHSISIAENAFFFLAKHVERIGQCKVFAWQNKNFSKWSACYQKINWLCAIKNHSWHVFSCLALRST